MAIWHSSDWHLFHDNIIRFDSRPDKTVDEMNARIIGVTNEYVGEKDIMVYHGDLLLDKSIDRDDMDGYIGRLRHFLDQLRCKNIIYVGGNHDRIYTRRLGEYLPNWDFWDLFQTRFECRQCKMLFSPRGRFGLPFRCKDDKNCRVFNAQRPIYDIHPMGYELRLTKKLCADHGIPPEFDGMLVLCTHYSHRVWNKSHSKQKKSEHLGRAINLYGHSHGDLPGIQNSFDVGFNIWNRPLSLLEILTKLMPEHNQTQDGKVYFGHHNDERE